MGHPTLKYTILCLAIAMQCCTRFLTENYLAHNMDQISDLQIQQVNKFYNIYMKLHDQFKTPVGFELNSTET